MAEKKLTREQAEELYNDLSRAMAQMHAKKMGGGTPSPSSAAKAAPTPTKGALRAKGATQYTRETTRKASAAPVRSFMTTSAAKRGSMSAFLFVAFFCCAKVSISALEAMGVGRVEEAQATIVPLAPKGPNWSKEEAKILTSLDHRRAELEERTNRLEQRELEFTVRDRDLALKLTELKELSERLKLERQKGEKQRDVQLDQLANVYGSMNPPEAAHLLEQLDIQIAQALIERMPEKRIGQILALMNAQRALELTNRLSKRTTK
jgi:flagellar motility protein MotE (MotC chaperone)